MNPPVLSAIPMLLPPFPPAWAEIFGEDDAGVFAEFGLKDARFVWRWIPPGRFRMGSPDDEPGRWDAEGPQHEVTITRGYWLGETPVTQAQWLALRARNPSRFQDDARPVEQVSWDECVAFAKDLNVAAPGLAAGLPSEAQWEYSCRGGTTGAYHDGSPCTQSEGLDPKLDRLGWFDRNSNQETHPVKQKRANDWGLYDLHGNVWEWCRDAWDGNAYGTRSGSVSDPEAVSAESGAPRVVRGGSWFGWARDCRAATRDGGHPGDRSDLQGFRLAAGLQL